MAHIDPPACTRVVLVLVGVPGSGKSHFCSRICAQSDESEQPCERICQDVLKTKQAVMSALTSTLTCGSRNMILVDRTHVDPAARADVVQTVRQWRRDDGGGEDGQPPTKKSKKASEKVRIVAVHLDMPRAVCEKRVVDRTEHEGHLQGGRAVGVVRAMYKKLYGDAAPTQPAAAAATAASAKPKDAFAALKLGAKQKWAATERSEGDTQAPAQALAVVRHRSEPRTPPETRDTWPAWSYALRRLALPAHEDPDRKATVLEVAENYVIATDAYPKSDIHLLGIVTDHQIDGPWRVRKSHTALLRSMKASLETHATRLAQEKGIPSYSIRYGFHRVPSMCQLHIHAISDDMSRVKNAKHYLSFTSSFFCEFDDAMHELDREGALDWRTSTWEPLLSLRPIPCHICTRISASERASSSLPTLDEGFDAVLTVRTAEMSDRVADVLCSSSTTTSTNLDVVLDSLDGLVVTSSSGTSASRAEPPPQGVPTFVHVPKLKAHLLQEHARTTRV